jgi:Recombination endonuclease VII
MDRKEYQKQYQEKNRERLKEYNKKWHEENKDTANARSKVNYAAHKDKTTEEEREERKAYYKQWRQDNIEQVKAKDKERRSTPEGRRLIKHWRLKTHYKMSIEQYEDLLVKQNHECAICETPQSELRVALGVDHDHKTGKIRGLLCDVCNRAIGLLKDNPILFMRAAAYVDEGVLSKWIEDSRKATASP